VASIREPSLINTLKATRGMSRELRATRLVARRVHGNVALV